ncbi:MAG: FecR domain-containing protein [Bacteroidales bacterium]|nr:FecR domain-containing protein [Bacteroidales bacterium]
MSSNKNKKQTGLLDYIVDLLQRYEQGQISNTTKQALDNWTPDITNIENYPMDEHKATDARKKVSKHVTAHIRRDMKRPAIQPIGRNRYRRYATAVVIFILLGGGVLHYTQNNTFNQPESGVMADANTFFQTTDAQIKQITLPDGSKIHLNRGTKVSYASNAFNRHQREVWLEGEAFFEVAKNPEKPFIIHTGVMTTTVRGTSFNVKAYPQLAENVVSVRTGKVQISQQGKQLAMLTPNEQIIYNTLNNQYKTGVADGENAAGWRDGRLILNSANAEELKLRLKQQYHVDLVIQDKALKDIMLNSSFAKGTSLNEVMNTIADFYNVKYNITSSGQVVLSE